MADDTPRYGARNDESARRYPEDAKATEDRKVRPSYLDSPHSDEPASADPYDRAAGTQDRSHSSLEGLRPSRYDNDETAPPARDSYLTPPPRENGSSRHDSTFDNDRYRSNSTPSSFGAPDTGQRNPLLKSDTAMRRFSWEDNDPPQPPARPSPPARDRDYDAPRYESRNPRLDELTAARAEQTASYGSNRSDDAQYRAPAPASTPRTPAPYPAPERPYGQEANAYTDQPYDPNSQGGYEQPYNDAAYQGVHSRELADVDQDYAREYQYNPEGADPRQGYGDYDPEFQQYDQQYGDFQEQPRRRGPFLLVGSLVGVAVIASGLIFAWQALKGGNEPTIPVVRVDENPIKVEPQTQPKAIETPRKTKLIYDRIRSEDTETESTLVPREEEPTIPAAQEQSTNDPNQLSINPTSETPQINADGTDPLPLPLPPPPVNNSQNTQTTQPTFNTTTQNLNTGGEVVVPTQNEPPAPASLDTATTVDTDQATTPPPSDAIAKLIQSPPLPREKPTPPSRQVDPGPAVPTGPIQIAPLPGSVERDIATTEQVTPDQNQVTQIQPTAPATQQVPTQEQPRRRTSRFSDELDTGTRVTNTQQNTQVAVAEPNAPTPEAVQPQAPITGGNYMIQTASFRSQEEAQAGFQELQSRHPSLLGTYSPLIQQADLGTRGTYYRLRIGPIETRSQASQLCNSLIAAGERDCVVRDRR